MKLRIRTKVVVALALACAAGLTTAASANAVVEEGTVDISGMSDDPGTWRANVPASWGCTVTVAPPTISVTCTLPTIRICRQVDVSVTAFGGPGTVTGTSACAPLAASVTVNAPGAGANTAVGNGAPPFTCTVTTTGNPAPWAVACHATVVSFP